MRIDTRLTFKQLRAFVAVYRLGKLAPAAEYLGVTQSAVSVLIRQIEETLNTRLFDRTTRSLSPTRAADDVFGIAERILQDVSVLGDNLRDLSEGHRGRIQLATTPATGMALLPPTVRRFTQRYPKIKLVLDDWAPSAFLAGILSEKVEFGIGATHADVAEFDSLPLQRDAVQLVCSANHPFAQVPHVPWADLRNVPLISFRGGYSMKQILNYVSRHSAIELDIAYEVDFLETAICLAVSGAGVAILPATLANLHKPDGLVIRPLVAPEMNRAIAVVTKKGRSLSPSCQLFVDMLIEDVGNLPANNALQNWGQSDDMLVGNS